MNPKFLTGAVTKTERLTRTVVPLSRPLRVSVVMSNSCGCVYT